MYTNTQTHTYTHARTHKMRTNFIENNVILNDRDVCSSGYVFAFMQITGGDKSERD